MRMKLSILSLVGMIILVSGADALAQVGLFKRLPTISTEHGGALLYSPHNKDYGAAYRFAPNPTLRYASERSQHRFAGATRVVLNRFDPIDKDANSAWLLLDNNDVIFSAFGEQQVTAVFYKPFQVTLTRLDGPDPEGKHRCIFTVELPVEFASVLGKSSMRLVALSTVKTQPRGVRLLLMSPQGQVTNTLDLQPPGNASGPFSVSHEPARSQRR